MRKAKPGKYAAVLPDLKPFEEDADYQQQVNAVKDQITERNDAIALAKRYDQLRREKDTLKEALSECNLMCAAYEQLLASSQEIGAAGWGEYGVGENAIRLPNGTTVRVQGEPTGVVKDREAFRLWGIKNGYERQMQLPYATMNAIVKERLAEGEPGPDGTEARRYDKIVWTKGAE